MSSSAEEQPSEPETAKAQPHSCHVWDHLTHHHHQATTDNSTSDRVASEHEQRVQASSCTHGRHRLSAIWPIRQGYSQEAEEDPAPWVVKGGAVGGAFGAAIGALVDVHNNKKLVDQLTAAAEEHAAANQRQHTTDATMDLISKPEKPSK